MTWYQVSLYRAGFSTNGVLDRTLQVCQIYAMYEFAMAGSTVLQHRSDILGDFVRGPYNGLVFPLLLSKILLIVQYAQAGFLATCKQRRKPISMILSTKVVLLFAGICVHYFGLVGTWNLHQAYWWGFGALEAFIETGICVFYNEELRDAKRLYERMQRLTLLLLADGLLALIKGCLTLMSRESLGLNTPCMIIMFCLPTILVLSIADHTAPCSNLLTDVVLDLRSLLYTTFPQ